MAGCRIRYIYGTRLYSYVPGYAGKIGDGAGREHQERFTVSVYIYGEIIFSKHDRRITGNWRRE